MKPRTLVLRTAGTNCDAEAIHAFELAGATASTLHVNRLLENPAQLNDYEILVFPGGFSYGDDIAAGKILANQITNHLRDALHDFIAAGKPIAGICNGFQVLVKTGFLPGQAAGSQQLPDSLGAAERIAQPCTLTNNDSGRFTDVWIRVAPVGKKCIWTNNMEPMDLPIAHGEGKFVCANDSVRRSLWQNDQIALIYVNPDNSQIKGGTNLNIKVPATFSLNATLNSNPNGSVDDIAGICDATGLVFGLMPHPERYVHPQQHYAWSTQRPLPTEGAGLAIFRNAVQHVESAVGAGI